jgi:hypothetical protein
VQKAPTPQQGFNNNVRHKGRVFHIQTEDSGVKHSRIVTHLYADGGRIVKTARTDYAKHVGSAGMANIVRGLMKEQHRGMFVALREGAFDDLVIEICGPYPDPAKAAPKRMSSRPRAPSKPPSKAPPPHPLPTKAPIPPESDGRTRAARSVEPDKPSLLLSGPPPQRRRLSNPNQKQASVPPPPAVTSPEPEQAASAKAPRSRPSKPPPSRRGRQSNRPPRKSTPAPERTSSIPAARPSAQFGDAPAPHSRSIFGDGVTEKSLDEVILSYLADDLEEPNND